MFFYFEFVSVYFGAENKTFKGQETLSDFDSLILHDYSTIMSFYHIRSRERAKHEAVIHWFGTPTWPA